MNFYDKCGRPVVYDDDGIYSYSGKPLAYIDGDAVYSYRGLQLGWYDQGWIRDINGACVMFTEGAIGGPIKPIPMLSPLRCLKQLKPLKGVKQLKRIKPIYSIWWSSLSVERFFSGL